MRLYSRVGNVTSVMYCTKSKMRKKRTGSCYNVVSDWCEIQGGPNKLAHFFVRLNFIRLDFIKYWPIFKLISLSGPGELSLKIPPHLKCVAALVKCQCLKSKNWKQDYRILL